jgi:hypothetical protein
LQGDEFTDFTILLKDKYDNEISVTLSDLGRLYPMLEGDFTKWPFNCIGMSREAVFQYYSIDLSEIQAQNKDFDISRIRKISFVFDRSVKGNIYLRNIGITQK